MKRLVAAIVSLVMLATSVVTPVAAVSNEPKQASPYVQIKLPDGNWGSGTYIGNGYFLTAHHVIDGFKTFSAVFEGGKNVPLVLVTTNRTYDFAILRTINSLVNAEVVPLACGVPNAPIGTPITLHGTPMGGDYEPLWYLETKGYIAGKSTSYSYWADVMPTDMTISWGMSGGGVTNDNGELIGIGVGILIIKGTLPIPISFVVPVKYICNQIEYKGIVL